MIPKSIQRVGLIGFGEAGGIFGQDMTAAGLQVRTFDILFRANQCRETMIEKARQLKVQPCDTPSDAIKGADLVLSAVTASSATDAAREAADSLSREQIFMDINSVSPETKREIAELVGPSAGAFVESAVMAPVPPQRLKVPMLLGGESAAEVAQLLQAIGMNATAISDRIGVASAIKMCRSIIIKGLESLAVESMFAARRHGAEEMVLASLAATYPQMGWSNGLPDYLVGRVAEHGRRRANEMREVAQTLTGVGLNPLMALATADRQDWLVDEMASRNIVYRNDEAFSWRALADQIAQAEAAQEASHNGTEPANKCEAARRKS